MTYKEYLAKPRSFQDQWDRTVQVITRVRDGVPLNVALREFGVSRKTVMRLAGPALRRLPNGRYVAKPTDRLLRVLPVPQQGGLRWIPVTDSREASVIGKFWDVVDEALRKGDASALRRFPRKWVMDESGQRVQLLTDFSELKRMASAGALRFESMYGGRV